LETGALPVELRPSVRGSDCTPGLAGIPARKSEHADQFEERDDGTEDTRVEPVAEDEDEPEREDAD
jgi:hypothetical protein